MSRFPLLLSLLLVLYGGIAQAADRKDAELALAQASTAVQAARRDDAQTYAPADFATAQTTLNTSLEAFDARAWTNSLIYAERARVDGELAGARSRQVRAETAATELERSLDTLRAQVSAGGAP
ncbi:DUF4398 domain-containing protein [Dokdonella sp.]|uniref:DUF4398 domain-containing protein n=1 Tax=Dokdonella sp. TaxID=2291710 RepID=UPI001B1E8F64|nr:DUF4398 domain-containing protein [Dokdonella sp.]MBO9661453.1 DUF4398 domain-containing protein [Dokdonella sp.]